MSQAENLLSTIAEEDWPTVDSTHETEPMIIIDENRVIHVPAELRRIAVQHDHNIEMVWFKCPRYWDSWDLSEMAVYINVKTPDDKLVSHAARSVHPNPVDNTMTFTWIITRDITQVKGQLTFLICVKKTDVNGLEMFHWNSELNKEMYISEGLECEVESILDSQPALVTDILTRLSSLERQDGNQPYYDIDLTSEVTVEPDTNADNVFTPDDLIDFHALVTAIDNGQTIRVKFNTHVQFSFVDVIAVETLSFTSVMRYESDIILNGVCRTMSLDNHYAAMMLFITSDGENYSSTLTYSPNPAAGGTVEVETDTTLSIAGVPADAKTVGDILGDISSILDSINGEVI